MIICSEVGLCVLFFQFNSSVFILCEIQVILAKVWKCFPQLSLGTTHEYIFTNTVLCLHTLCITLHTANVYYEHRSSKVIACFILLFFFCSLRVQKKANEMIKKQQNIHVYYLFCISVALWCKYEFSVEYYCAIDTFYCGVLKCQLLSSIGFWSFLTKPFPSNHQNIKSPKNRLQTHNQSLFVHIIYGFESYLKLCTQIMWIFQKCFDRILSPLDILMVTNALNKS